MQISQGFRRGEARSRRCASEYNRVSGARMAVLNLHGYSGSVLADAEVEGLARTSQG